MTEKRLIHEGPAGVANRVLLTDADGNPYTAGGGGGGGGGGGATTIADGADVAQGARADAAATSDTGTFSIVSLIKRGLGNWTTLLGRIPAANTPGLLPVDTLAAVDVARQLAAGGASANTALTTTCRRISIHARGADIRYAIGTSAQTASSTSHFIAAGERLDLDVAANSQIAVIRAGSTDGTLELSELTQ
jgi:hypothetical protein